MSETWLPGVEILPMPPWKRGYWGFLDRTLDQIEGEVKHSAEGPWSALIGELMTPKLKSWTFSIRNDGHIAQHAPLEAITWHCGVMGDMDTETELVGNVTLVGEEYEGKGVDGMLTTAQVEASYYISDQVQIFTPNSYGSHKAELEVNLWEHGWISNTTCPNDRVDWPAHLAYLNREEDMTDGQWKAIETGLRQIVEGLHLEKGGDLPSQVGIPFEESTWGRIQALSDKMDFLADKLAAIGGSGCHNHSEED
ncbi:hypothetical protein LCGC14_2212110 [marine sediment metagenome]|uniref:N-acetylmuramoyl-L-alanine amidase domain-containing protein n=1 Tax=marine sediment metagenome TaxID=412755 RepID=A0A0F9FR17_9ZZZZ